MMIPEMVRLRVLNIIGYVVMILDWVFGGQKGGIPAFNDREERRFVALMPALRRA